mmetsp:Transcript_61853/g.145476  ORF Transcript_61853/g.145476 Transcript_61853/m.145476 type:complete len:515 (+) Transcript_61853:600-2144(+)
MRRVLVLLRALEARRLALLKLEGARGNAVLHCELEAVVEQAALQVQLLHKLALDLPRLAHPLRPAGVAESATAAQAGAALREDGEGAAGPRLAGLRVKAEANRGPRVEPLAKAEARLLRHADLLEQRHLLFGVLVEEDGHDAGVVLALDGARVVLVVRNRRVPRNQLAAPLLGHERVVERVHFAAESVEAELELSFERHERVAAFPHLQLGDELAEEDEALLRAVLVGHDHQQEPVAFSARRGRQTSRSNLHSGAPSLIRRNRQRSVLSLRLQAARVQKLAADVDDDVAEGEVAVVADRGGAARGRGAWEEAVVGVHPVSVLLVQRLEQHAQRVHRRHVEPAEEGEHRKVLEGPGVDGAMRRQPQPLRPGARLGGEAEAVLGAEAEEAAEEADALLQLVLPLLARAAALPRHVHKDRHHHGRDDDDQQLPDRPRAACDVARHAHAVLIRSAGDRAGWHLIVPRARRASCHALARRVSRLKAWRALEHAGVLRVVARRAQVAARPVLVPRQYRAG